MKICQVVAYISADGAYGGPVTVALEQCRSLAQSHEVVLVAGWDGRWRPGALPFRTRLRRAARLTRSFGGLVSPGVALDTARAARRADVVHVHLARDLTTMVAGLVCRLSGVRYVVQSHGMLGPARGPLMRLYDAVLTRFVLDGAQVCLVLTDEDAAAVRSIAPLLPATKVRNAVPRQPAGPAPEPGTALEVAFCSRLHPRKRVLLFAEMAGLLHADGAPYRTVVLGPDGGDLPELQEWTTRHGAEQWLPYLGALPAQAVVDRLRDVGVLVLPSRDEPFPMVVLEALSVGVPVVIDRTCGLADILDGRAGARVVDSTPESLAAAVRSITADLPAESEAARELAAQEFSPERLRTDLESIYAAARR